MKGIRRCRVLMIAAALVLVKAGCGDMAAVPESTADNRSGSVAAGVYCVHSV